MSLVVAARHEVEASVPQRLGRIVAEETFGRRVPVDDSLVLANDMHAIGSVIEQCEQF